jgi:serine/threonine-protein kinase
VIHSDPSGGSTATEGSTVLLTVSTGPKLVKVPILVETQRSTAVRRIRSQGLVPSVSEEASSAPAGQVVRQSPSAGSEVDPGSTVSIVVSEGEETATVPNVIGKLRPDAVAALREAGLKPTVSEQETDVPSKVGRVTDQFPPPGAEVEPGASVTVVVGKAPPAPVEEEEE